MEGDSETTHNAQGVKGREQQNTVESRQTRTAGGTTFVEQFHHSETHGGPASTLMVRLKVSVHNTHQICPGRLRIDRKPGVENKQQQKQQQRQKRRLHDNSNNKRRTATSGFSKRGKVSYTPTKATSRRASTTAAAITRVTCKPPKAQSYTLSGHQARTCNIIGGHVSLPGNVPTWQKIFIITGTRAGKF